MVPETIRAAVDRRVGGLTEATRRTLDAAAVLGAEFRLEVLLAMTGATREALLAALDEAVSAQLLHERDLGRYAFVHALVRDARYTGLGVARRARLHEQAAEALQRLEADDAAVEPADLAYHFAQAAPAGRASDAIAYARRAADVAMRMLAYEDAAGHLERALVLLDMAPGSCERADVLLALGDARTAAGDRPGARAAYLGAAERAQASGDADRLAAAALGLGGGQIGFEVGLFDREQVALLEQAVEAAPAGSALRPWLLARLSVAISLDAPLERRARLSEQAIAAARAAGDESALAYALAAHCDVIAGPADTEVRLAEATEIVAIAEALGDARMELLGRRLRLVALLETADVDAADAEIAAFERRADAIRQPLYSWYVPLWRATRALMSGRLDEAERWLDEAELRGTSAHSTNARMLVAAHRWCRLIDVGDVEEQAVLMHDASTTEGISAPDAQVALMRAAAVAGETERVRRDLDRLGAEALAAIPRHSEWLPLMAQLAEVVSLIGGHDVAGWAYEALLPHRRRCSVEGIGAYSHGSVERHLGLLAAALGRPGDARAHFDAALAANRAAGAELIVARTLRDAGAALGDAPPPVASPPPAGVFAREGEMWRLTWNGRTARVVDRKGLADLARLLAQPGREVPALDLAGTPGGDLGAVVDARARAAYKRRLAELESELEAADAAGDLGRSERAATERDALVAQLSAAYGLGGRVRVAGDPAERARSAVTARIRDALKRIDAAHPELGRHLRHSVRTGRFCVYEPERPVTWTV
jgi:hypothetical protein